MSIFSGQASPRFERAIILSIGLYGVLHIGWSVVWTAIDISWSPASVASNLRIGLVALYCFGIIYCLFGTFVVYKVGDDASRRTFALMIISYGFVVGLNFPPSYTWPDWRISLPYGLLSILSIVTFLRAMQTFPQRLEGRTRENIQLSASPIRLIWPVLNWLLRPHRVWMVGFLCVSTLWLFDYPLYLLREPYGQLVFLFCLSLIALVALSNSLVQHKIAVDEVRVKFNWFLFAIILFIVGPTLRVIVVMLDVWLLNLLNIAAENGESFRQATMILISFAQHLLVLFALVMTLFHYGTIDSRLVLQRTAVLGFVVAVLLFTFAVFVNYVSEELARAFGIQESLIEAIFGTLIALMFRPIHKRIMLFTNKLL